MSKFNKNKTALPSDDEEKEDAYRLKFLDELISLHKAQFPRLSKEVEAALKAEFDVFEEDDE